MTITPLSFLRLPAASLSLAADPVLVQVLAQVPLLRQQPPRSSEQVALVLALQLFLLVQAKRKQARQGRPPAVLPVLRQVRTFRPSRPAVINHTSGSVRPRRTQRYHSLDTVFPGFLFPYLPLPQYHSSINA